MRQIFRIVSLLLACAVAAGSALAQKYPTKPIRVIVPQPPGDPCDTFGRLIGHKVGERLGQQLVVDVGRRRQGNGQHGEPPGRCGAVHARHPRLPGSLPGHFAG